MRQFAHVWRAATSRYVGIVVLALALLPSTAKSDPKCKKVTIDPKEEKRYKLRGSRCEGLYVGNHAGGTDAVLLALSERTSMGVHGGVDPGGLKLTWTVAAPSGAASAELELRGMASPGGRHYQMDAQVALNAGEYLWPLDLLGLIQLAPERVQLLAYLQTVVAGRPGQAVYVPIRRGNVQGPTVAYDFVLEPQQNMQTLSYSIHLLEANSWVKQGARIPVSVMGGAAKSPLTVSIPQSEVPPLANDRYSAFLRIEADLTGCWSENGRK